MPRFLVSPHPVMVGLVHGCCELKRKEEEEKVSWCRARQALSPSTIRLGACCQLQAAPHHMAPSHRRPFRGAAGWSSSGGKRRRWPAWNLEVSPVGSCAGGDGFRAPLIFLCLAIGIRISDGPFLWER